MLSISRNSCFTTCIKLQYGMANPTLLPGSLDKCFAVMNTASVFVFLYNLLIASVIYILIFNHTFKWYLKGYLYIWTCSVVYILCVFVSTDWASWGEARVWERRFSGHHSSYVHSVQRQWHTSPSQRKFSVYKLLQDDLQLYNFFIQSSWSWVLSLLLIGEHPLQCFSFKKILVLPRTQPPLFATCLHIVILCIVSGHCIAVSSPRATPPPMPAGQWWKTRRKTLNSNNAPWGFPIICLHWGN